MVVFHWLTENQKSLVEAQKTEREQNWKCNNPNNFKRTLQLELETKIVISKAILLTLIRHYIFFLSIM
jgi:type I site-specific restriction-modification system R (restriction) subunit